MENETITIKVEDLRECLGNVTRLINEIRLDGDLVNKIPKSKDYVEIKRILNMAHRYACMFTDELNTSKEN